jgi:hypothetical protein
LTHHTSCRFMGDVLEGGLSPLHGLLLSFFVSCHVGVSRVEVGTFDVRPDQFLYELAYLAQSDRP